MIEHRTKTIFVGGKAPKCKNPHLFAVDQTVSKLLIGLVIVVDVIKVIIDVFRFSDRFIT